MSVAVRARELLLRAPLNELVTGTAGDRYIAVSVVLLDPELKLLIRVRVIIQMKRKLNIEYPGVLEPK